MAGMKPRHAATLPDENLCRLRGCPDAGKSRSRVRDTYERFMAPLRCLQMFPLRIARKLVSNCYFNGSLRLRIEGFSEENARFDRIFACTCLFRDPTRFGICFCKLR